MPYGFMPGRSITDAINIFTLRQLIEEYREGQHNLHWMFIDLEKAYDCVTREEVWNCLLLKSTPETYIQLIQAMYEGNTTHVSCMSGCNELFAVVVRIHQESALSPFLFTIFMNCRTENIRRALCQIIFADDVFLCTNTREKLQKRLEIWRKAL